MMNDDQVREAVKAIVGRFLEDDDDLASSTQYLAAALAQAEQRGMARAAEIAEFEHSVGTNGIGIAAAIRHDAIYDRAAIRRAGGEG